MDFLANLQGGLIAFCPYIFVITTADDDNNNNNKLNDNKYEKKTKDKHGGFGLQVLTLVLMLPIVSVHAFFHF